jgi:hypothetical protein
VRTAKAAGTVALKLGSRIASDVADSLIAQSGLAAAVAHQVGYVPRGGAAAMATTTTGRAPLPSAPGAAGAGIGASGLPAVYRCPRCQQLLQAPPDAPLFRCTCGCVLKR